MTTRRDTSPPDVLFVQPHGVVDHLPGVAAELAARGLTAERQDEQHRPPRVRMGTRVVVVTDVLDPRCVRALRMARKVDARTVLLMDGLVEWRNTYANPRVGDGFLRPAPVDVVCCSGLVDARTLTTFGNTCRPTGLPRIDDRFGESMPRDERAPILVATANTPAFNDDERERLLEAILQGGVLAMADCSTEDDARHAKAGGVQILGTTLSGYTAETEGRGDAPDLDLVRRLATLGRFVMAEGRYNTPALAAAALGAGADAVTVGSAITRLEHVTGWFSAALDRRSAP